MKEGLLKTWYIHNEKNLLLLGQLEESTLVIRSGKSRSIGEQLVHMHNTRIKWTEFVAKKIYDKTLLILKEEHLSTTTLATSLTASHRKIEEVIENSWDNGGKLPSFRSGLIPFIGYLISHESHHRGNILLTLKQSGIKLAEELKWGLWDWDKL